MISMTRRFVLAVAVLGLVAGATARGDVVLWYNGDFDGQDGLANALNTTISDARVYDDFQVNDLSGWTLSSVFSNNLMNFTGVTQAHWEIRTGVSSGNEGTLVAGGDATATQTATGATAFGYTEYTIAVDGLNVVLGTGLYFLAVTPIGSGSGISFNSTTDGASAVGTPPGNNGNSFFDSDFFGANFEPASDYVSVPADFSMGVIGSVNGSVTAVPEASTIVMSGLVVLAGLGYGWRNRKRASS